MTKVVLTAEKGKSLVVDDFEGEANDVDEVLLRYSHALEMFSAVGRF